MFRIARIEELITYSESTLNTYQAVLAESPNSFFAKGMVKNTTERLSELRENLALEKRLREKEVITLRLMGKAAKLGRLSLELLGDFSKHFSSYINQAGSYYQFGNNVSTQRLNTVKNTIDLKFERLIPGSTKILITGNTNPDLFGNSIIEEALLNSFNLLNANNPDELFEATNKVGTRSITALSKLLNTSINNDLEFELDWQSPNNKTYQWTGEKETLKKITHSISNIKPKDPTTVNFIGNLYSASLKGFIEIKEEDARPIKILFPNEMLESIKSFAIGELCEGSYEKKTLVNSVTSTETSTYYLLSINTK